MRILVAWLCLLLPHISAAEKSIRIFVALCDNKSQGIMPVGEKIGNGDNPDANLYWGCSDGFGSYFKASKAWKVKESASEISETILRRMVLQREVDDARITAEAYRGSAIRQCVEDFEKAAGSGEYDLVAFIGHNGLMDFTLPEPPQRPSSKTVAVVLCCLSNQYFGPRLEKLGCRPILLTQQLMYPGAFLLHEAIRVWLRGGSNAEIALAAAQAYARNQKISVRAASKVFATIPQPR
jgi:hypothetical protein